MNAPFVWHTGWSIIIPKELEPCPNCGIKPKKKEPECDSCGYKYDTARKLTESTIFYCDKCGCHYLAYCEKHAGDK